jgi:hypothetical protein
VRNGTIWLLGGILSIIVVAGVAWLLVNVLFGFIVVLLKLLIVVVVVVAAALFVRGLFTRANKTRI